jgi:hypothetical protein
MVALSHLLFELVSVEAGIFLSTARSTGRKADGALSLSAEVVVYVTLYLHGGIGMNRGAPETY